MENKSFKTVGKVVQGVATCSFVIICFSIIQLYNVQQKERQAKQTKLINLIKANDKLNKITNPILLLLAKEQALAAKSEQIKIPFYTSPPKITKPQNLKSKDYNDLIYKLFKIPKKVNLKTYDPKIILKDDKKKVNYKIYDPKITLKDDKWWVVKNYDDAISTFVADSKKAGYKNEDVISIWNISRCDNNDPISNISNKFYQKRLSIEFAHQNNLISEQTFLDEKAQLLDFYTNTILSLTPNIEEYIRNSRLSLLINNFGADDIVDYLHAIRQFLQDSAQKVEQTRPSSLEKWLPLYTGIFSSIIALLSCLIALAVGISTILYNWRKDARESLEFSLKQRELAGSLVIPSNAEVDRIISSHKKYK